MNIGDMSYGTCRTVLTRTLVTQLVDICGDMWQVITRANSSHIVGKLMTVGQRLKVVFGQVESVYKQECSVTYSYRFRQN